MKTDRSRLMGSKEPPGYFCEAFSYIRFLFFRGSNYSIKTNRLPAGRPPIAPGRSGCRLRRIDVIAHKRNYEFTCYLQSFRKALTLFVMMRNVSIPVILSVRERQSYTTDSTSIRATIGRKPCKRSILRCHVQ